MLLGRWERPTLQASEATGDVVSTRTVHFDSQPQQIVFLRQMVDEYRGVNAIRARARDIAFRQRGCPPRDQVCQALAIAGWVQDSITYVQELPETFQTPTTTVAQGYGDCDDFTTLIAAMCESIGIECQLVGLRWGGYYQHIFPRARIVKAGQVMLIPLDATLVAPVEDMRDPIRLALARGAKLKIFVG